MKRSVRINLRKVDCGNCARWVVTKINIWMQNGRHNMLPTQLREIQKRRSLLVLKSIKKTYFMPPNKCVQKIREKHIQGNNGNLSLDDASKKLAWKQHYE